MISNPFDSEIFVRTQESSFTTCLATTQTTPPSKPHSRPAGGKWFVKFEVITEATLKINLWNVMQCILVDRD
jgi:hypothetical protein